MKRKFRQALSACLIGLLVSQSTYGLVPALAAGVPARAASMPATPSDLASASDWIDSVHFDVSDVEVSVGENKTVTGSIEFNGDLGTPSNWASDYSKFNNWFNFKSEDGIINVASYTLAFKNDGTFELTFSVNVSDTSEDLIDNLLLGVKSGDGKDVTDPMGSIGVSVKDDEDIEDNLVGFTYGLADIVPVMMTAGADSIPVKKINITEKEEKHLPADVEPQDLLTVNITGDDKAVDVKVGSNENDVWVFVKPIEAGTCKIQILPKDEYKEFAELVGEDTFTVTVAEEGHIYTVSLAGTTESILHDPETGENYAGENIPVVAGKVYQLWYDYSECPDDMRLDTWECSDPSVEVTPVPGTIWFSFTMPAKDDITFTPVLRDATHEMSKKTIRFDLNPDGEDYAEERQIDILSDYEEYEILDDYDKDLISIEKVDRAFIVSPKDKTGATTITSTAKKESGDGVIEAKLSVIVKDTGIQDPVQDAVVDTAGPEVAISESVDQKVDESIDSALSDLPADLDESEKEILKAEAKAVADDAVASIVTNAAIKVNVTGFTPQEMTHAGNYEEIVRDYYAGVPMEIYPKQDMIGMEMTMEPSTDENGVTTYKPVVNQVSYEIHPRVRAKDTPEDEGHRLNDARGRFTFRIPVPKGISADARYARVKHEGDPDRSYRIQNRNDENADWYIEVTVTHFSEFQLTFTKNDETTSTGGGGSRGGGGGGSSTSTSTTGTWIRDAIGWWYRNADNSYPYGTWANLYYSTNSYKWYHFNAQGYMETGWFTDVDGHRYYLHPVSDGTQGYMYTGWHQIDGNWYYFAETKTDSNPTGSLLVNTTTPDGYTVNADGIWVQ